jgi:alpha-1,3-rhamnosyltransferase
VNTLVSVIIPAYNHEQYIQETIKSIINQTYQNIELIVIDDGSKDNTYQKMYEIKAECEKRFVRVHFEKKDNEGICATLNKLVSLAQGDYVYIIASDDLSKPQAIEKEVKFLENNPDYSLVVGDNEIINKNGEICFWDKKRNIVCDKEKAKYLTFAEYLQKTSSLDFNTKDFGTYKTLIVRNYIPNGYLIRKSIYNKIGKYPEGEFLEDWWFMLQLAKYSKMKYLDKVLFLYRWHETNTIKNHKKIQKLARNNLTLELDIQNKINRNDVNDDVLKVIDEGVLYKKQGIPFLFEILTIKKGVNKIKKIKLFNIPILEYKKEI